MKVSILSTNEINGGAARAANRLHRALVSCSIDSQMIVGFKQSDDWRTLGPSKTVRKFQAKVLEWCDRIPLKLQKTENTFSHTSGWVSGLKAHKINNSSADVVNLHWVCAGLLSIEEIGRITKPVVWTLHDMWPFSGAEHYGSDGSGARWRQGYITVKKPSGHKGLDIDRWVWKRKCRAWKTPIHVVAPSQWLADCARNSSLMNNWPVSVIPNPLDTKLFKPWPKKLARQLLGLPQEGQLILFGASGGTKDLRKGWDLLEAALNKLPLKSPRVSGVIFGQSQPPEPLSLELPLVWLGRLNDEVTLALVYSASDVMVVPSRQENLPQSGTEAQACGCPVVAFNVSGLPSVVIHKETGYLAESFDINDLATGIAWVLENSDRRKQLSTRARERAVQLWSPEVVTDSYLKVYHQAIDKNRISQANIKPYADCQT